MESSVEFETVKTMVTIRGVDSYICPPLGEVIVVNAIVGQEDNPVLFPVGLTPQGAKQLLVSLSLALEKIESSNDGSVN